MESKQTNKTNII